MIVAQWWRTGGSSQKPWVRFLVTSLHYVKRYISSWRKMFKAPLSLLDSFSQCLLYCLSVGFDCLSASLVTSQPISCLSTFVSEELACLIFFLVKLAHWMLLHNNMLNNECVLCFVHLLTKLFTNREALLLAKMTHRYLTESLLNQLAQARPLMSHLTKHHMKQTLIVNKFQCYVRECTNICAAFVHALTVGRHRRCQKWLADM